MSSVNVKPGNTVTISVLFSGAGSGSFPQAVIVNEAGESISGSPLSLTHVLSSSDVYASDFTFPADALKCTAETTLYTDAAHLTGSVAYERAIDEYVAMNDFSGSAGADPDAIASAVWDELLTGGTHNINNSSGKILRNLKERGVISDDTAQGGAASSITLAASEPAIDSVFQDYLVVIVGGLGAGQVRIITAYDGTTKIATVHRDWEVVPDATSEYVIGIFGATTAVNVDAIAIAGAVWEEETTDHQTAGSFGQKVGKKLLTFIKFLATKDS